MSTKPEEKKETLEDVVRRTQREYALAASLLLDAKDALTSVLNKVKEAQDNAIRAQSTFSAAKEQHMAFVIQQQNEQLKSLQSGEYASQRQDNVNSPTVVVDMKGQPFSLPTAASAQVSV